MPNPSLILGVLLAVCFAWGSAATWYAADLIEQKATVEANLKEANTNTEKQKQINAELRADVAAEQRALKVLGEERKKDDERFQRDLSRIAQQRSKAEQAAQKYPERYGRAATFRFRRSMRDICRSGGGDTETCRIDPVHPTEAIPGAAAEPNLGAP